MNLMCFNKMVYWEICCRANDTGFRCEIPAGSYVLGDPEEMLLPGVYATTTHLKTGAFSDAESDAIIIICQVLARQFTLNDENGKETLIMSESGTIALMSADIVKPDAKYSDQQIDFDNRTVVEVNISKEIVRIKTPGCTIVMSPFEENYDNQSDENMYVGLYAAQGINY